MITSVEEVAPAVSVLSLPRLQSLLREYGPAHFNKDGQHPLLYFQILLLTQQFEVVSRISKKGNVVRIRPSTKHLTLTKNKNNQFGLENFFSLFGNNVLKCYL
jgi:hypothetical protein